MRKEQGQETWDGNIYIDALNNLEYLGFIKPSGPYK